MAGYWRLVMAKYIVTINYGYGDEHDIIDAESLIEANNTAYAMWREQAESQATYEAIDYSEKTAIDLGLVE